MTDALQKLVEAAKSVKAKASDNELQRRSFAYGNTKFENDKITRDMVDQEAERLSRAKDERS